MRDRTHVILPFFKQLPGPARAFTIEGLYSRCFIAHRTGASSTDLHNSGRCTRGIMRVAYPRIPVAMNAVPGRRE